MKKNKKRNKRNSRPLSGIIKDGQVSYTYEIIKTEDGFKWVKVLRKGG